MINRSIEPDPRSTRWALPNYPTNPLDPARPALCRVVDQLALAIPEAEMDVCIIVLGFVNLMIDDYR